MSQRHTYSPKARYIKKFSVVTFLLRTSHNSHFFKEKLYYQGFQQKERHTYSCLVIEC